MRNSNKMLRYPFWKTSQKKRYMRHTYLCVMVNFSIFKTRELTQFCTKTSLCRFLNITQIIVTECIYYMPICSLILYVAFSHTCRKYDRKSLWSFSAYLHIYSFDPFNPPWGSSSFGLDMFKEEHFKASFM